MSLRHQAVMRLAAIALACLLAGGCARLAQALLSPQETLASTASDLADRASAGTRQELEGLSQEVDRLRSLRSGDPGEIDRLNQELLRRKTGQGGRSGAAQRDPARRQPWDARTRPVAAAPADDLVVERRPQSRTREMPPASSPLPDGTPSAHLPAPLELRRIRSLPGSGNRVLEP